MGKDANELAMRDPALAALMGVTGSNFGHETQLAPAGADFGTDFGDDEYDGGFTDIGYDFENEYTGADFGVDFGYDFASPFGAPPAAPHPAARPAPHAHPAVAHAQQILKQHAMKQHAREKRAMLLEPNKHSDLKVERYTFSVNATITALGTAGALSGSNSPDVNFRPQRVTTNVVSPGMVTLTDIRVANVSFSVGGMLDAWQFNANAVGQHMDVPTLTPANKATFSGSYSGLVPSPLSGTGSYPFILSFTGPASIVA